jgi:F-box interacting protein
MASPRPPAARRVAPDTSNAGPLILDGLYEVLLRLPAKELCRLRAVCRQWRSLLSAPHFAAAHAARHQETLFLVSYGAGGAKHGGLVDVLDARGRVVKRVRRKEGEDVVSMTSDLVCVKKTEGGAFQLMNPATGSVYQLPNKLPEEHLDPGFMPCHYGDPLHVFGKVASTGEYKVLRMFQYRLGGDCKDLFEVSTVNGRSPGQWRRKQRPTEPFVWNEWTRVVIGGVVYFLTVDAYLSALIHQTTVKSWIVSFNLEAEDWGPSINGPSNLVDDGRLNGYHGSPSKQLTLTNLNGSLVIVHGPTPYMDLWYLMDSHKGIWTKNYSVQIEQYGRVLPVHPLTLLDDWRIVIEILGPDTNS